MENVEQWLKKSKTCGFLGSLVVHLFVFAVPLSIGSTSYRCNEVEFFIEEGNSTSRKEEVRNNLVKRTLSSPEPIKAVPVESATSKNVAVTAEKTSHEIPDESPPETSSEALKDTGFGSDEGPRFIHMEKPFYPLMAKRLGIEGQVVLRLFIDEAGNLTHIEVVERGCCGFTESAVEAMKKSTFAPARENGKPVASSALLRVRFVLKDAE